MKIVHVIHNFLPYIGGNTIQIYETARRQARFFDVEVYTTDPKKQYKRYEIIENFKVYRFPSFAPYRAYYVSLALYRALKDVSGDILHVHSFLAATSFSVYLAFNGGRNGFKRIIFSPYFHEVASTPFRDLLHKFYDQIQKKLFFWADKVICVTEYERDVLNRKFKVPMDKMQIVSTGMDCSEFLEYQHVERIYDFEILYAGRVEKHKNIHQVIYSLPLLIEKFPEKKIHFTVVGKGSFENKLRKIITKYGVSDFVTLKGFVTRQDLIKHYRRADVFVSLANYESFGITIVEALSAGTPVLISEIPLAKDIINGNGLVVRDFNQLPNKLEYFLENKVDVNFDPKTYSWDTNVEQTTKLYFD